MRSGWAFPSSLLTDFKVDVLDTLCAIWSGCSDRPDLPATHSTGHRVRSMHMPTRIVPALYNLLLRLKGLTRPGRTVARWMALCLLSLSLVQGAWAQHRQLEEMLRQQRYTEAVPLMTTLAERGDADMQMRLALLYFQGAVPTDGLGQGRGPNGEPYPDGRAWAALARGWLQRVVNQPGVSEANARAAWHGIAMSWCCWPRFSSAIQLQPSEWSAAVAAFEQAVARGNGASMLMLAELYATPKGVPRNDARALELLSRLATVSEVEPSIKAKGQQMAAVIEERSRTESSQAAEAAAATARRAEQERAAQEARRQQYLAQQEADRRRAEEGRERERVAREREERERPAREAAARAQAEADRAESARQQREQTRVCEELRPVCPRLVFAGKPVIEEIANRLSVYPGAIRLDRVTHEKGMFGCSCQAVFWTPGGTLSCTVRQYSGLTVTAAGGCSR
jgi:hypothetical protein